MKILDKFLYQAIIFTFWTHSVSPIVFSLLSTAMISHDFFFLIGESNPLFVDIFTKKFSVSELPSERTWKSASSHQLCSGATILLCPSGEVGVCISLPLLAYPAASWCHSGVSSFPAKGDILGNHQILSGAFSPWIPPIPGAHSIHSFPKAWHQLGIWLVCSALWTVTQWSKLRPSLFCTSKKSMASHEGAFVSSLATATGWSLTLFYS